MGLSKPIIVNTQQVTVTEQAVDLSGIENTLATIKADASAAKTSAAQAAEAAREGGAEGCIGITMVKYNTSMDANTTLTLANVTGAGFLDLDFVADSYSTDIYYTIIIDGQTLLNGKTSNTFPIKRYTYNGLNRIPFKESCKVTCKNNYDGIRRNQADLQITLI